jgi:hypothetical protein
MKRAWREGKQLQLRQMTGSWREWTAVEKCERSRYVQSVIKVNLPDADVGAKADHLGVVEHSVLLHSMHDIVIGHRLCNVTTLYTRHGR